jgi:4'-phosphopantetheinyl transferase
VTRGEVHVWTIDLDAEPAAITALLGSLSGEERARAARLRTTELRLRFVVAHGALRAILSRYLETPAASIRLETTSAGKPFVCDSHIGFNLSHSDGVALCAVTLDAQIGVDVERIRPVPDADAIVRRYFAAGEARAYTVMPPPDRTPAFFSIWTRKEAFVKAIGDGLQCPLDSFEVDGTPSAAEPGITIDPTRGAWYLRAFAPAPGYIAAVACDVPIDSFERFEFTDGISAPEATDRRHRRLLL